MTYAKSHYNQIIEDIEQCGRQVLCVGGEDDAPSFAYTIGNWQRGLPELLVIGTTSGGFLNDLSEKMIERGGRFAEGEIVSLGGKWPVKIITANAQAQQDYTIQAGNFYGHDDYPVQQVLMPDPEGRFPDDPQCMERYRLPILLTRQ